MQESPSSNQLTILIDCETAAHELGVTPKTLGQWRWNGRGPKFVRISRRCIRYRRADLNEWAESRVKSCTSEK